MAQKTAKSAEPQLDRAAALDAVTKIIDGKRKLGDGALMWGGVVNLKKLLAAQRTDALVELTARTAKDGNGMTDFALACIVALPAAGTVKRKGGVVKQREVVTGDLVVDGELTVTGAMFVTGDVKAKAVTVAETGILVVGGSLEARALGGDGWLWVRRDAKAELVLGYDEAGELRINQTLTASLGITSNHGSFVGKNKVKRWFELEDVDADDDDYLALERVVNPKALVDEDDEAELGVHRVDFRKLSKLALAGQPVLGSRR